VTQPGRTMVNFSLSTCRALNLLFLIALAINTFSQSADEVHIVPRSLPQNSHQDDLAVQMKAVRVDVDLVLVPVVVTNSQGAPILDLQKKEFQLFDSEHEQTIRYFYSEDAPISVGIIVDFSSSMSNKIDRVRQAVSEFFRNADPRDDYFVITFANRPRLLADTTQSTETIQSDLADIRSKGGTALADAIYMGIEKLRKAQYRRKALVIISDGGDNMSRHSLRAVKHRARESDAQIYAIDICDSPSILVTKKLEERFGKQWLTEVTEQTGGRTIALDNSAGIPDAASRISTELRNEYVLAYKPSTAAYDGKWRKLKVRVTRPAAPLPYQVYYRTGYLAKKEEH